MGPYYLIFCATSNAFTKYFDFVGLLTFILYLVFFPTNQPKYLCYYHSHLNAYSATFLRVINTVRHGPDFVQHNGIE
jgi:hypothetical protein